jgi:hypothetical protein
LWQLKVEDLNLNLILISIAPSRKIVMTKTGAPYDSHVVARPAGNIKAIYFCGAPPATRFNHPLISRRKESNLDKSLKIIRPGIDGKVSLS